MCMATNNDSFSHLFLLLNIRLKMVLFTPLMVAEKREKIEKSGKFWKEIAMFDTFSRSSICYTFKSNVIRTRSRLKTFSEMYFTWIKRGKKEPFKKCVCERCNNVLSATARFRNQITHRFSHSLSLSLSLSLLKFCSRWEDGCIGCDCWYVSTCVCMCVYTLESVQRTHRHILRFPLVCHLPPSFAAIQTTLIIESWSSASFRKYWQTIQVNQHQVK